MKKYHFAFLGVLLSPIFLTGCVSQNKNILSVNIDANELSGHVHFLAQPALKGREPLSSGSKTAREYITKQFKAFGLVPWSNAKSYLQSFVAGANVIGVLPGSDPNLKDEFVIVCAHYDHVGKTKDGGMCLGACDNASGTAAMLEIAENLSLSKIKPKRSICFIAFDCEEFGLLGSFAFSSRSDFDGEKIAGVVNIDALGRYGYEVLNEHLFVSGIDECMPLLHEIKQTDSEIQLLPVSKEIVGIRGDHFPFELLNCPVLFFCNGMFEDYHKSTDTADKLDYNKMLESTIIINHTINVIANEQERFERKFSPEGQTQVLASLKICLEHIITGYTKLGWTETELDSMKVLLEKLKELQQKPQIDSDACRIFLINQFENLLPLISWPDKINDANTYWSKRHDQYQNWKYAVLSTDLYPEIIETGREFVRHLEKYRSRLILGIPEFYKKEYVLPDNYISITNIDKDTYCMVYIIASMGVRINPPGLLKIFNNDPLMKQGFMLNSRFFKGTKGELVDNCLMRWRKNELDKIEYPSDTKGVDDDHWPKLLSKITEITTLETYEQWLKYHLAQSGLETEEQWLVHNAQSANPDVAEPVIDLINRLLPNQAKEILVGLISNKSLHPRIRVTAIRALKYIGSSELLVLVNLLDDETDCRPEIPKPCADNLLSTIIEFRDGPVLRTIPTPIPKEGTYYKVTIDPKAKGNKPIYMITKGSEGDSIIPLIFQPGTIGDCAWRSLAELTNQNFEKNKEKWITWIQAHEGQIFPDPNRPKGKIKSFHVGLNL